MGIDGDNFNLIVGADLSRVGPYTAKAEGDYEVEKSQEGSQAFGGQIGIAYDQPLPVIQPSEIIASLTAGWEDVFQLSGDARFLSKALSERFGIGPKLGVERLFVSVDTTLPANGYSDEIDPDPNLIALLTGGASFLYTPVPDRPGVPRFLFDVEGGRARFAIKGVDGKNYLNSGPVWEVNAFLVFPLPQKKGGAPLPDAAPPSGGGGAIVAPPSPAPAPGAAPSPPTAFDYTRDFREDYNAWVREYTSLTAAFTGSGFSLSAPPVVSPDSDLHLLSFLLGEADKQMTELGRLKEEIRTMASVVEKTEEGDLADKKVVESDSASSGKKAHQQAIKRHRSEVSQWEETLSKQIKILEKRQRKRIKADKIDVARLPEITFGSSRLVSVRSGGLEDALFPFTGTASDDAVIHVTEDDGRWKLDEVSLEGGKLKIDKREFERFSPGIHDFSILVRKGDEVRTETLTLEIVETFFTIPQRDITIGGGAREVEISFEGDLDTINYAYTDSGRFVPLEVRADEKKIVVAPDFSEKTRVDGQRRILFYRTNGVLAAAVTLYSNRFKKATALTSTFQPTDTDKIITVERLDGPVHILYSGNADEIAKISGSFVKDWKKGSAGTIKIFLWPGAPKFIPITIRRWSGSSVTLLVTTEGDLTRFEKTGGGLYKIEESGGVMKAFRPEQGAVYQVYNGPVSEVFVKDHIGRITQQLIARLKETTAIPSVVLKANIKLKGTVHPDGKADLTITPEVTQTSWGKEKGNPPTSEVVRLIRRELANTLAEFPFPIQEGTSYSVDQSFAILTHANNNRETPLTDKQFDLLVRAKVLAIFQDYKNNGGDWTGRLTGKVNFDPADGTWLVLMDNETSLPSELREKFIKPVRAIIRQAASEHAKSGQSGIGFLINFEDS